MPNYVACLLTAGPAALLNTAAFWVMTLAAGSEGRSCITLIPVPSPELVKALDWPILMPPGGITPNPVVGLALMSSLGVTVADAGGTGLVGVKPEVAGLETGFSTLMSGR